MTISITITSDEFHKEINCNSHKINKELIEKVLFNVKRELKELYDYSHRQK